MHSQGRGLFSVMLKHLPDIDTRTLREARVRLQLARSASTSATATCTTRPDRGGAEALPVRTRRADRRLGRVASLAAARCSTTRSSTRRSGVVERGTWTVDDAVEEQPWLPNGPIPTQVTCDRPARQRRPEPAAHRDTALHEHRDGRRQRAQRARRRAHPRRGGRRGDGARGRRRDRRRHAQQRAHRCPGLLHDHCSAVHPLAVGSPFSSGLDLGALRARPGAGPRSTVSTRSTAASAGVLYRSVEETAAGLGSDGARWRALFGAARRRASTPSPTTSCGRCCACPHHPLDAGPVRRCRPCCRPRSCSRGSFRTEQARALFAGVAAHAFRPLTRR